MTRHGEPLRLRMRGVITRPVQFVLWHLMRPIKPEGRRDLWAVSVASGVVALALPYVPAIVAAPITDFGHRSDVGLLGALAQVLPVLALTALVAQRESLQGFFRSLEQRAHPETPEQAWRTNITMAASSVYRQMAYFTAAEAASLIALGLGYSTTFLAVAALTGALLLTLTIVNASVYHLEDFLRERPQDADEAAVSRR